jgi:hypothetical protein
MKVRRPTHTVSKAAAGAAALQTTLQSPLVTESRRRDAFALSILGALITILFLDLLLGINSLYARDITSYYYPAKKVLREIVLGGHFPSWNPWFSAGQPMAANPEHEVFYPLTWLILLPSFLAGFHLLVLVHLYLAAFAMYAFLRSMSTRPPAAFFGALSFTLGGLVLSYLNLLPYLFSVAWMPLTCLYTRRFLLGEGSRIADRGSQAPPTTDNRQPTTALAHWSSQSWWHGGLLRSAICDLRSASFALATLFLALQLLIGEPTTILQTGILLGLYALSAKPILRRLGQVALICVAALLSSAVQFLPSLDHYRDSVRATGFPFEIVSLWSLPPARLAELVYPSILGNMTVEGTAPYWGRGVYAPKADPFILSIYSGLLLTALAAAGLLSRRRAGLVSSILVVSIVLALGSHTPLLRILYDTGLARSTRYPEKFILMAVFALIVFGARMLDQLLEGDIRIRRTAIGVAAAVTLVALGAWLFSHTSVYAPLFRSFWHLPAIPTPDMLQASRRGWLIAFGSGALLLILLRNVTHTPRRVWLALAGLFTVLDLAPLLPRLAPRLPASFYSVAPPSTTGFPPNRDEYRVFNYADWVRMRGDVGRYRSVDPDSYWRLRNSLYPMVPATYGLRTVIDVDYDLTALQPTADFTSAVWAISERRPRDWIRRIAAMSNIWYVGVFERPEVAIARAQGRTKDLQPVRFLEGPHFPRYSFAENLAAVTSTADFIDKAASDRYPPNTAFVSNTPPTALFKPAPAIVQRWREWPNGSHLEVAAPGRAFLVMSITPHKYWHITIDGKEAPAITTNLAYQGVVIPPGQHVVEMDYRNPLIPAGAAISLATLLALVLLTRRR